ncbi:MAG: RNA polymerase factor sigma-32 [Proteobacteria bacterium]|nr:RNA polymerase factor sigma-32 [Pseudomonadota bacterium]
MAERPPDKSRRPASGRRSPRAPSAPRAAVASEGPASAVGRLPGDHEGDHEEDTELDQVEPTPEQLADEPDAPGHDEGAAPAEVLELVAETSGTEHEERVEELATLAPASRSLAVRDPLQAYINETRRYPLLSAEEEHALAVRFFEQGDAEAARQLVTANLRLVVKIAHSYRKAYRNLLDLVQEGNVGLMHAVKKFDPYRGVKLSSYAAWWIRAYILKFVLANWRLVKIGTTQGQRTLFYNLRREVEALQRMGIDEPGPKLLAERLSVTEQEVQMMQKRLAGGDVSLDAPLGGDDQGTSRLDFVAATTAGPEQQVEQRELSGLLRDKVGTFGQTLRGREREIFELRTIAEEPLTLQEIGDRYGITRERARQIERRVMDRLRDYLRAELGDAVDVALGRDDGPR